MRSVWRWISRYLVVTFALTVTGVVLFTIWTGQAFASVIVTIGPFRVPWSATAFGLSVAATGILQIYNALDHHKYNRNKYRIQVTKQFLLLPRIRDELVHDIRKWTLLVARAMLFVDRMVLWDKFPEKMAELPTKFGLDALTFEDWQQIYQNYFRSKGFTEDKPYVMVISSPFRGINPALIRKHLESIDDNARLMGDLVKVVWAGRENDDPGSETQKNTQATLREAVPQLNAGGNALYGWDSSLPEGKREVVFLNFEDLFQFDPDVLLNVDGDGYLADEFALANTAIVFLENPDIDLMTGDVRPFNVGKGDHLGSKANFRTRMTLIRYLWAFVYERGGQRNQVTCVSGPLEAMRPHIFLKYGDDWRVSRLLGREYGKMNPGDDREWATRALRDGLLVTVNLDARVYTDCPSDRIDWQGQQKRWSISALMFNLMLVPRLYMLSAAVIFDIVRQSLWSLLNISILIQVVLRVYKAAAKNGLFTGEALLGAKAGWDVLWPYLLVVLVVNLLLRSLPLFYVTRDFRMFYWPLYNWYTYTFLMWIRLWAWRKVRQSERSWYTRLVQK